MPFLSRILFIKRVQEEDFDEDEGIYDELNLDEEEEKFGLALDDDDSDESDVASEGNFYFTCVGWCSTRPQTCHLGHLQRSMTRRA
jgi:hypothetical protein